MSDTAILREHLATELAAVFGDPQNANANAASRKAILDAELPRDQFDLVEAESRRIAPGGIIVAARLGLAGLLIGALLAAVLILSGVDMAGSSPVLSIGFLMFFGAIVGLLIGGLLTVRHGHAKALPAAGSARRHGKLRVVMHPADRDQLKRAPGVLAAESQQPRDTL